MAYLALQSSNGVADTLETLETERIQRLINLDQDALGQQSDFHEIGNIPRHQEYNKIVDRLSEFQPRPCRDPVESLPPEICARIWHEACDSVNELLVLTLVHTAWQETILATPELWAEITIGFSLLQPDRLAKLFTCLVLSKSCLLYISIMGQFREWGLLIEVLSPHAYRIGSIYYVITDIMVPEEVILPTLLMLPLCPQLQHLCIGGASGPVPRKTPHPRDLRTPWSRILDLFPSLISIMASTIPISLLTSYPNREALKYINIWQGLDTFISDINSFPSIQNLGAGLVDPYNAVGLQFDDLERQANPPVEVSAPSTLKYLTFSIHPDFHRDIATYLRAMPMLVNLHLDIPWTRAYDVFVLLEGLPLLECFTLRILTPHPALYYLKAPPEMPISRVKTLSFLYSSGWAKESADALLLMIERTFKHVQDLTLAVAHASDVPYGYITSLSTLQRLSLTLWDFKSLPETFQIHSATLQSLWLSIPEEIETDIGPKINCTNLSKLQLIRHSLNVDADGVSPSKDFIIGPTFHKHLHKLTSESSYLRLGTFNSIKTVVLEGTRVRVITDFFTQIIRCPEQLPNLDRIDLSTCPEWDTLFIMLERRNFLTQSGISRIKTLELPWNIPLYLLRPIADLLRGHFTVRPSNEEVCVTAVADINFDATILGCFSCCLALQPCKAPIIESDNVDAPLKKKSDTNTLQSWTPPVQNSSPLPMATNLWLEGSSERWKDWDRREITHERISACEIANIGPILITENTLCDIPIVSVVNDI